MAFLASSRFSIATVLHEDNVHLLGENMTDYAYVGPASSQPAETSRSGAHIRVGFMSYFVLVMIVLIQSGWDE